MTTRTGQRVGAQPSPRDGQRSGGRPVPERSTDFAHLSLTALRAYRRTLTHEESRVSYWRRLIQARLDVLRDDSGHAAPGRPRQGRAAARRARRGPTR